MDSLNDAMKDLSYRMGEAGTTTGVLTDAVHGVSQATGIATDKAADLVTQLRQLRVPTEIVQEMATNTARFSEITGVSAEASARLSGEMMRIGRLGADATTKILAGMTAVQRRIGMTSGEMQELSEGIIYSTKMLNLMGKSAAQIEQFNKGVTKLAAAFTQVGLSAEEANKFVTDLLDPGKVEDNALLYAKLGISLEDAFAGDVDPGLLASKFKELGMEMQNMAGPAAAALAEQLGYGVGQLRQFGEMDLSELESVFSGGADAAGELAEQQQNQLSTQDKLEKTMNRLRDTFVGLADELLPFIEKFATLVSNIVERFGGLGKLMQVAIMVGLVAFKMLISRIGKGFRRRFLSVATDMKQSISTGIIEGMEQGSRHGAAAMRKNISGGAMARQQRVRGGAQFGEMTETAADFDTMAGGNLTSGVKSMTEGTAEYLRNISAGAKPLSRIGVLTAENNKRISDRLGFIRQEGAAITGMLSTRRQSAEQTQKEITGRLEYLRIHNKEAENHWEIVKLRKQEEKLSDTIKNSTIENSKELSRFAERERRTINRLGEDQLRNLAQENKARTEGLLNESRISRKRIKDGEISLELIKASKVAHANDYMMLKKLEEEEREIALDISNQKSFRTQSLIELRKISDQQKVLKVAAKGADIMNPNAAAKASSIWRKTGSFLGSTMRKASQHIDDAWDKAKNSAKQIVKNMVEKMKPSNIMAGVRRRFSAEGRAEASESRATGGGGGLGKIMKMLGPIMMIAGMLMRMEPIQKLLASVMDKIKPILQQLGEKLAPIFQKLADALMPILNILINALMPVFDTLSRVIGIILEKIGPMLGNLVKLLLPPLIWVLGLVLGILGKVVEAIGSLLKFMMELPARIGASIAHPFNEEKRRAKITEAQDRLRDNAVYNVFNEIAKVGIELAEAGRNLRQSQIEFNEGVGAVTAATVGGSAGTRTWSPAQLRAAENGIRVQSNVRENVEGQTLSAMQQVALNTEEQNKHLEDIEGNTGAALSFSEKATLRMENPNSPEYEGGEFGGTGATESF